MGRWQGWLWQIGVVLAERRDESRSWRLAMAALVRIASDKLGLGFCVWVCKGERPLGP